ncbi:macrophage colony-stimulating factor 1 [Carettochelys insculpta]|uniref:macrophage colony-stimulating factor 1 n=1 Tax=Carettochelys insculpta TaxID=44489 RepID=UPI003EBDC155
MAASRRAAPGPGSRPPAAPQMCPVPCTLLTFLLLTTCSVHETEQKGYCENIITQKHLDKLQELIDSQMLTSCHISFEFIDERALGDSQCFVKAAFPQLGDILEKMKFKENSANFNTTKDVRNMYKKIDENDVPCIADQDDHERELSQACLEEFSMPPEKMLQLVKNFFQEVMILLDKNVDFAHDCSTIYQKCSDSPRKKPPSSGVGTDRDCNCPSPSPRREGPPPLTTKPFPSTVPHLGSKETAASSRLPHGPPAAAQTSAKTRNSAKPRVTRSTQKGPVTMEIQGVWPRTSATVSSPPAELELASESQGLGSGSVSPELLLDLTEPPSQPDPSAEDIFTSPPSLLALGGEMAPTGTEDQRIHVWPTGPGEFLRAPGSPDPPSSAKQAQALAGEDAMPATWPSTAAELSTHLMGPSSEDFLSSPALTSEAEDASGADPGGRLVIPLWPVPSLGSKEPISIMQHRFSRMAPTMDSPPAPESPPRGSLQPPARPGEAPDTQHNMALQGERARGLPRFREPEDSQAGPIPDLTILPPNIDQHRREAQPRETQREVMTYILVAILATLAILLAVGGLLFYMHKSRTLARRQWQRGNSREELEGRPLNGLEERLELRELGEL